MTRTEPHHTPAAEPTSLAPDKQQTQSSTEETMETVPLETIDADLIERVKQRSVEAYGPEAIYLFGSAPGGRPVTAATWICSL